MVGVLVGREPVLATALAALEEAMAGTGQLLLVSGEPGIGKSAVLAEVGAQAAARGARVLRGVCWDGGGAPAYWPWTQVLRTAVGLGLGLDELGTAGRLLADPVDRDPAGGRTGPTENADPAGARFRLLDAVGLALARLAADATVVVVLDDLQWADEPSLQLLDFLGRQLRAEPVLLVGAYRDAEAGPALRAVVGGGQHLPLVGLSVADVRELMVAVAAPHDQAPPPDALAAQVWRRSGGNPFFARELTRLVLAQGGWGTADRVVRGTGGTIPDTVRDTLERRLARLSQPCAEVLAVAAVAGVEVHEEVLALVVSGDGDRLPVAELLAEAAGARVLTSPVEQGGRYCFSHDLYRETIQAGLAPAVRSTLHVAIARALQARRAAGAEVHIAELAAHLLAAGSKEALADAVRYSAAAGAEAMVRLGFEDARAHYERALAASERLDGDPAPRIELLLALADARYACGDRDGTQAELNRATALARQLGDDAGLARAALAQHSLGARGASAQAIANVELLTEAAAALPQEPSPLRARVLTAVVRSRRHQYTAEDQAEIVAAGREAVRVATVVGDPAALAHALLALHDALWQPGTGAQRLEVLDEMRTAAAAAGERDLFAQTFQLRAAALLESGAAEGRHELARYAELIAARGHARGRWESISRTATLAMIGGQWAEAERLTVEAYEFGRSIGEPDAVGVLGTMRASLMTVSQVADESGLTSDQFVAGAPAPAYVPLLQAGELVAQGDLSAARELLRGYAVDDLRPSHDLEGLAILATVMAAAGSHEQRTRVYERLEPYTGLHAIIGGCAGYWGAVDHLLGELASALGWHDQAVQHLESAATGYQRLGAPAWGSVCAQRLEQLGDAGDGSDSAAGDEQQPAFSFDGGSWELAYQGRRVHLPDAKGLRDIAMLLSTPGHPIHVLRLIGVEEPTGADPVLDEQARNAYRARLAVLDAEIEHAQGWQDPVRAERATVERDALISELTAAAGLAGRTRRLGDRSERARKTVTARIRDALRRIDRAHPELAEHLRTTISTGTECEYLPERSMSSRV